VRGRHAPGQNAKKRAPPSKAMMLPVM
jgi:hypothetical protein